MIILNDKQIDFSKMFYNNIFLKEFSIISQNGEEIKNEIKTEHNNNQIILNKDYSFEKNNLYNNLLYDFSQVNEKSDITNQSIKSFVSFKNYFHNIISIPLKNEISEEGNEQISQVFFKSHDYLYPSSSLDSIKFENNIKEFSSTNEFLFKQKIANKIIKIINKNDKINFCDKIYQSFCGVCERNVIKVSDFSYMFYGCKSLKSISGISKFNTSNIMNISHMFEKCSSLIYICNISKWITNKINEMQCLFADCSSLVSLPDISKWNTNSTKNMNKLFYNCSSLKTLPDISK